MLCSTSTPEGLQLPGHPKPLRLQASMGFAEQKRNIAYSPSKPFQKIKGHGTRKRKRCNPANIKIWAQPPLPNTKHPSRSMEMEVICFTTWAQTLGIWSNNSHIYIHKGWKMYTFLFIMCIRDTGARIYSIIYIYTHVCTLQTLEVNSNTPSQCATVTEGEHCGDSVWRADITVSALLADHLTNEKLWALGSSEESSHKC